MTKNRKLAYLAAAGNALIWGAALPIVKPALSFVTPHQFLFLRYAIAAPILLPLLLWGLVKKPLPLKRLLPIIILEIISMTVLYLIYLGLARTTSLQAAFIINTKPIFIVLAGVLILKEVEEKNELLGLIISVVGITLVIASPIIFSLEQSIPDKSSILGNLLIVIAILIDTLRMLGVKKYYRDLNPFSIVAISSLIGLVYFGFLGHQTHTIPSISALTFPPVALAAIYMGTLGTILAFAFQFIAYTKIEASEATLFEYLQPLVYIPLAVLWLGETLLPTQLIGLVIIAAGVFLAEQRKRKRKKLLPVA